MRILKIIGTIFSATLIGCWSPLVVAAPFSFTDNFTAGLDSSWSQTFSPSGIYDSNWSLAGTSGGLQVTYGEPGTPPTGTTQFATTRISRALPGLSDFSASYSMQFNQNNGGDPNHASWGVDLAVLSGGTLVGYQQIDGTGTGSTNQFGTNFKAAVDGSFIRNDGFGQNVLVVGGTPVSVGSYDVSISRNASNNVSIDWTVFTDTGDKLVQSGSGYVIDNTAGVPTSSVAGVSSGLVDNIFLRFYTVSVDGDVTLFNQTNFDNLLITSLSISGTAADIPEPAIMLIFGLGMAGLGLSRRRQTA